MPAINAHGEFTPTPENHITPRPHPIHHSMRPCGTLWRWPSTTLTTYVYVWVMESLIHQPDLDSLTALNMFLVVAFVFIPRISKSDCPFLF